MKQYIKRIEKAVILNSQVKAYTKEGHQEAALEALRGLCKLPIVAHRNTVSDWKKYAETFLNQSRQIALESDVSPLLAMEKSLHYQAKIQAQDHVKAIKGVMEDLLSDYCEMINALCLGDTTPWSFELCRFIKEHLEERLSTKVLADQFFLSPSYLSRRFKKEMGLTITDYIKSVRMEKAKELLANTDISISSIASKVGYEDSQYFSASFKRQEGQTPSQYRKTS